jgi:hypothetical protein
MLPLLRAAQRGGHDVLVTSGANLGPLLVRLGVTAHESGKTFAEGYEQLPGQQTISELPPAEQPLFAARHLFGVGAARRARDLMRLFDSWRPDLVVHDTMELGSAAAAITRDIPHVTHGYGPLVPGSDQFATAIGKAVVDAGLPDPVPAVLAGAYLDICPPSLRGPDANPWADVRPLRPSPGERGDGSQLDVSTMPYPDTVYMTLGTVMNQAPAVFRAVIDGATQWPVNVVATTGPDLDPAVLGPVPPAVRLAPYLAQADVLPHCTVVISHAGAGTMLGALCYGLPQLCLPQSTDQPFNAAALLPTGAALMLAPQEVTADAVASAVGDLLHEPAFRDAAQRLRTEIEGMPGAEAVLEQLVADPHG